MNPKVNYTQFDAKFLSVKEPQKKTSKPNPSKPTVEYFILQLIYNYGTEEKPNWRDFDLEGPEFDTYGVREGHPTFAPERTDYSILISFKQDNPEHLKYLEIVDKVYWICVDFIYKHRFTIGKKTFDNKSPKGSFLYPIYIPEDENGPIEGKNKSFFLQLYERGAYKTLLTLLDKKTNVDKKALIGLAVQVVPCTTFKWIHVGQDIRFQTELRSAVIKDFNERVIETSQTDTIDKMLEDNPEMEALLMAKFAKLMANKQNLPPQKEEKKEDDKQDDKQDNKQENKDDKEEQNLLDGIQPTASQIPDNIGVKSQQKKQFKIPTH
jgi:hypothetical protein